MAEKLISVFFLVASIVYTYYAHHLSFGTFAAPKAGFLPVISGQIAIILALILVIKPWAQANMRQAVNINWRKLVFVIAGLLFYIVLFKLVGYLAATFVIMFYLLKMTETTGWLIPGLLSAGVAASFYFIFEKLLGCNLS